MTDRFRPQYRELNADEKALIEAIKDKAAELEALFTNANPNKGDRYHALAITSLEQSVMWIVKGITS
jgi:hypothetical protein